MIEGSHLKATLTGITTEAAVYDPSYGKLYQAATMAQAEKNWEDAALNAWGYQYVNPADESDVIPGATALHNADGPRETIFGA